jgi:hypothetical protein
MKRILFVLLLFSTIAQAQTPSGYTRVNQKYEWYGGKFISELGVPVRDTSTAPKFIGEIIYNDDDSLCYIGIATSGNKWKQIGITPGSLGVTSVNVSASGALGSTGGPITSTGTITLAWQGASTQYVKGNGTLSTFDTDVQLVGDDRYLAIDDFTDHSHVASDISNLTTTVRNLFSAGSGLEYDAGTGVFSYPGSGTEITTINGLTAAIQTFTGVNISISSVGSGHTFTIDTTTLLSTKAHTQHIADSLGALMGVGEVTQEQLDDTAAAIRADMDFNLIVESLGATGTPVFRDNNDSLYIRKIVAGPFVLVDTLATGEIQVSVDTASTDFHNYIALYGNDGGGEGGDGNLVRAGVYGDGTHNVWIDTTTRRVSYSEGNFIYRLAITDSIDNTDYDTDAQAYIDEVNATDVTLTTGQKTAINDYIIGLKADGVWALIYDQGLPLWGTAASSAITLKSIAPSTTWVNSPTFGSTGVTGNGTTQYGDLGFSPATAYSGQNNAHLAVYIQNSVTDVNQSDISSNTASPTRITRINSRAGSATQTYMNDATSSTATVATSAGFTLISRTSSTNIAHYKNGSFIANSTVTSAGLGTQNFYILAGNQQGTPGVYSTRTMSLWSVGATLDATQQGNLANRVNQLMTDLGINVY